MIKKIFLITHIEDLDGIGAAAILKRYYEANDECSLYYYFSNYDNFTNIFLNILIKEFDLLYILDIGFNDEYSKIFLEQKIDNEYYNRNTLLTKFRKIKWFDHHNIESENKKLLKKYLLNFIHQVEDTCTSKIIYEYLNKNFNWNDDVARKIAIYANEVDHDKKTEMSFMLHRVITANQDNIKNLYKITHYLSIGDFKNEWILEQNSKREIIEQKEFERIMDNLMSLNINNFKIIIGYSDILTRGCLAKYLIKKIEADIYITINKNLVSIRSNKYRVVEIAKAFHGGGHPHRAGFQYSNNLIENGKLDQDFLDKFKKLLQKGLKLLN